MKTLAALALIFGITAMAYPQKLKESHADYKKRMAWFDEARFGMFIHWGLYSLLEGEWNGSKGHAEWIRTTAQIPIDEYNKLQPKFNPVRFEAEKWAKMAHDAGMKYLVITTKHHDGFGLFDSKYTDWDVMNTPFKRDILKEMAAACKKHNVKLCFYHSIMDWHHPDYLPRRDWEVANRPANGANFDRFVEYLRNQVTELLTNYGDIGIMWFDGEWESTWSDQYGTPLYNLCRTLQPNVIVNNRVSVSRRGSMEASEPEQGMVGDYMTPEQYIPPTGIPGMEWESCMTMNDHWGWNKNDKNWKSSTTLIRNLVDIVSKGGNYLLNIGPTGEGEFPQLAVDRLKEIGTWMDVNHDAIYGTTASLFESITWGRSTTKVHGNGATLNFFVFDWPKSGKLEIPGLASLPKSAKILGHSENLKASAGMGSLELTVPHQAPDKHATVIQMEFATAPVVYRTPKLHTDAEKFIDATEISMQASTDAMELHYTLDGSTPTAASPKYTKPVNVRTNAEVAVAGFVAGKQVTGVVKQKLQKVDPWPSSALDIAGNGLAVKRYEGKWDTMPDFAKLTPASTYTASVPELPAKKEEFVALVFTGGIRVPKTGMYRFELTSDDGSLLLVDGKVVVDNDGLHGSTAKTELVALAGGMHRIEIRYFNKEGGADLSLRWSLATEKLAKAEASAFSRLKD
ncbi:MAG: alpha-L-fucosidase [Armatimonadetes bacterium]|nr:alpha-L-fucosidase [Armatimonadota bacterium]